MSDKRKNKKKNLQFQDWIAQMYPEDINTDTSADGRLDDKKVLKSLTRTVTFQVTDACNLACKYCYQINKGHREMPFETAKLFVDKLLSGEDGFKEYLGNSPGIILEFIGGEPFLEVDLIDKIVDYFRTQTIKLNHPWAEKFCISICSNGVLYRDPKVQKFLQKNCHNISFSVTVDGTKELHDSCRVFPDGSPSYDLAHDAAMDWKSRGYYMGSKITISPGNIRYLHGAVAQMVDDGYDDIFANCVYEEGWTTEHATELYRQCKEISDDLEERGIDKNEFYFSLLTDDWNKPLPESDNKNWCWGKGTPVLTTKGYKPIEEIIIGDEVYTEDGSIHPVIRTTHHHADNMVRISASGMFDMYCTDDHKIFAQPFDYIGNGCVKHFKDYGRNEVKDLKRKDLVRLSTLPADRNVHFDEGLAYLVGRYIGDGWDYREGNDHAICCSFAEADGLEESFKWAGVDYYAVRNKTVMQYSVATDNGNGTKVLNDILKECGHLAGGKKFPYQCLEWDDESLSALIKGYIDADGYSTKTGQVKMNTVSRELAYDVMLILRTLGYHPTCHIDRRSGRSAIEGREVTIKDRYEVYFFPDRKSRYIVDKDDKMWTTDFTVEPSDPQEVYNITVDENHSYIAGCLVSSNCGGTGLMLAMDPDGKLYPCLRYMESSIGTDQKPLIIGDVWHGIAQKQCEKDCIRCMDEVTRRSQSTDECFYCPIASGCSWCSAYNYQVNGTVNKRVTYICQMHKAQSLAMVYYWNSFYKKHNIDDHVDMWLPREWGEPIIGKEEYDMLAELTESVGGKVNYNKTAIHGYEPEIQPE